jgi:hypothetical protein
MHHARPGGQTLAIRLACIPFRKKNIFRLLRGPIGHGRENHPLGLARALTGLPAPGAPVGIVKSTLKLHGGGKKRGVHATHERHLQSPASTNANCVSIGPAFPSSRTKSPAA